jgi:ATP-binding protein involved in chromosome partitioning
MSIYICPDCGHEDHVFGHGGAREEAAKRGVAFLGEVPLNGKIREDSDNGVKSANPAYPQLVHRLLKELGENDTVRPA